MVYTKRKYKRSYQPKRPGYISCGKMVLSDAQKALNLALGLKRLVNVEVKNFDVQQTAVSISTTPVIVQLSNIPQGDTTITRDGAQCKILSIDFNMHVVRNASAAVTIVRLILVCDKQTNQAIYTSGDLLEDITSNDNIESPLNLDNKFRFTVLWDRRFNLSAPYSGVGMVRKRVSMNKILRFDGSTPSIADLTSNSLSLLQVSNESTNTPNITMFSRLRFVDN